MPTPTDSAPSDSSPADSAPADGEPDEAELWERHPVDADEVAEAHEQVERMGDHRRQATDDQGTSSA